METLFRNTLGPVGWVVMGLVPLAIFALYFLKLRRRPVEVPSTYLWHRVIEDLHVNSLWQRLRRSLLLFLQLLLVALAILALLRPGWEGQSLQGQRFIFLIDRSASMSATDLESGETRFDEAIRRVGDFVDQLEEDMSAMIISFADQPDVVQEFTNNRRLLHNALARIEPLPAQTELVGALELADGFANPSRVTIESGNIELDVTKQQDVQLYILSDGRFRSVEDFSLGNLRPLYFPIGTAKADNLAITALNTRRNEERPESQQAFVQVANLSDAPQTVVVEVALGGGLHDAAKLTIPPDASASTTFNLPADAEGTLEASLDMPSGFHDALSLDNRAYAVVASHRDAHVLLVTPGNTTLETALTTERAHRLAQVDKIDPAELAKPDFAERAATELYDFIIFDRCAPAVMPQANTLFIGLLPPLENWQPVAEVDNTMTGPQIIDWDRSHPLLSLVELGGVLINHAVETAPPLGGRVLVETTEGPVLAIAPRSGYEDAVLGFEISSTDDAGNRVYNTDWPRKHSYPGFWLNVLEYFTGGIDAAQQTNRPDLAVELKVDSAAEKLEIELPDHTRRTQPLAEPGRLEFFDTEQLGVYTVRDQGQIVGRFAVNLFDRDESDVRLRTKQEGEDGVTTVESLSIGYVDVQAESPTQPVRKELWKLLVAGALVVLLLEWYIYNRRVYL